MFEFIKHDFSKEAKFKDELFIKMKMLYEKPRGEVTELSDDELNLIAAATDKFDEKECPLASVKCERCENYIKSNNKTHYCKMNYKKK